MIPRTGVPSMLGKTFAHYVVLEKAGSGGMGVVFRAHDETLQRDVALKLPSTSTLIDKEARERVLREARAASALNHPHICTIYEVGEVEGQPYIAMEYIAGETLNKRIPSKGMPSEPVLDLGAQIADALEHAHTRGILHRDLKSANIRITPTGQLKVLDFGLALKIKEASFEGVTRSTNLDTGGVAGTLSYMAPELLQGSAPDVRSDIWSLGVVLHELATGALPFQGRTGYELTTAILREPPASLPMHVTPGLRAVILHCLAKDPEKRYQHASEVRAALEALQSDTGVTRPVGPKEGQRSSRWILLASAGLLCAAAFLFIVYIRMNRSADIRNTGGKLRLFVSSEGYLSGPTLSSDGKMVAYIQHDKEGEELYVSRVAGGSHVQLTKDGSRKDDPQFSPDGEKIAFVRQVSNPPQPELCIIPTLGGAPVPVILGAESPAWSYDGSRFAFIQRKQGEHDKLATAKVDGSDVRIILEGDDVYPFLGHMAWSPDGALLAVSRSRGGGNRNLWVMPAEGGALRPLVQDGPGVLSDSPVFSPDGRGVIHRSNRGGASNLWWQPLDGQAPVQLTTGTGPDAYPSVERDGQIAFQVSRARNSLLLHSLVDGTNTELMTDSSRLWAPAFSPDGKEIAYSRDEPDGSWHVWIIPARGGTPRQLTSGRVPEIYPRYTRDGAGIVFNSWASEPLSVWHVPVSGGPAKLLIGPTSASDAYADVSPDGKSVVFTRAETKISRLYVASIRGDATPRRVLESSATVPRWSPDGKWISFSPNRSFSSGVFIVHPDGTGLQRLSDTGGWAVWWPDGEHLGFQVEGSDGNEQIQVLTVKTGELRTLPGLHFVGTNFPFDVSRDVKSLITTNYQHISDEIWLLEPAQRKQ